MLQGISLDAGVCVHVGPLGIDHLRIAALETAADFHRSAAVATRGIQFRARHQTHVVAGDGNAAAYSRVTAGIQGTRHFGDTALAMQDDLAILARLHRLRVNDAGMVNDGGGKVFCRAGGQHHRAALGVYRASIFDQGGQCFGLHLQLYRTTHIQANPLPGPQQHRTIIGEYVAVVFNLGGNHHHEATLGGGQTAMVDDSITTTAFEAVIPRHEVFGTDIERGGHQPTHVHLRCLAEQDAVGIH